MKNSSFLLAACVLSASHFSLLRAQETVSQPVSLLANGDFETDANRDDAPDDWGRTDANRAWLNEDGNRFLRLQATEPDTLLSLYRTVKIPPQTKALQLSWRQRVSNLKVGKQAWHDARIMLNFKDEQNQRVEPGPAAPYVRANVPQWQQKSVDFLVPEGARVLEIMPALFNVQSGTFDIDDVKLIAVDDAALLEARRVKAERDKRNAVPIEAPQKEKWPSELRVQGVQVLTADGKSVWLQGANVVSLEFLVTGDHVMSSIRTAIENWRANVIRLPVKGDYWWGKEATDDGAAYRERVDNAITLAANRGAYVILDLHHYRAPRASDVKFWTSAAARYKNHPAVLFDLLNEPHGISWQVWRDGGFVPDDAATESEMAALSDEEKARGVKGFHSPGMQAMLDAVRATGAKNVVVAGGLDWAYDLSGVVDGFALKDNGGRGLIYATHIYPWKRDWAGKVLPAAAKFPILVGEVGADVKKFDFIPLTAQENPATWVPDVLGFIQKNRLHWTAWSFHPATSPVMIADWDYTPTPFWGAWAKRALAGEQFPLKKMR